ncbi:MAG: restriction endonuclease [Terracidiphilus sp.]
MTATQIVEHLEKALGPSGEPRRVKAVIEAELVQAFNYPPARAAELAELRAASVTRIISKKQQVSFESGTLYALAIVGASFDTVAGSCYPLPSDSPQVVALKRQRIAASDILAAMRALDFNQFERFGAKILAELGAQNAQVTRQSNDQGIDFFGELSVGTLGTVPIPFLKLAHDLRFIIVGQAKHYPTRSLGTDVVRELVGAMSLARTKTFSKDNLDILDGVSLKPFSPLVALLFTTGELSSGTVHLANSAGIIARNGEQLSVFLADRGVGMVETNGIKTFAPQTFRDWIAAPVSAT